MRLPPKKSRPYAAWSHMKARCQNKNSKDYPRWGGRGIKVCQEWQTFRGFWEDMGPTYKDDLQIDRIDNDGNYEPSNCKWATPKEQANNRTNTIFIEIDGSRRTLSEWADIKGIKYRTLWARINDHGFTPEQAILLPYGSRKVDYLG